MFGLELWFVLAVLSALVGGLYAFLHKVVVQQDLDVYVVTFLGSAISTLLLVTATIFMGLWSFVVGSVLFFAFLWGVLFSINLILKVEALRYIDSAIYFPIYKVAGPMFVIVAGMVFFAESFTIFEWIGLIFSMTVPLMLINKSENSRQKNLKLGLFILVVGALLATVAAAAAKQGLSMTTNPIAFLTAEYIFLTLSALLLLVYKNGFNTGSHVAISLQKPGAKINILFTGVLSFVGVGLAHAALYFGGPLGIVYNINSLYILIPIVLSVIYYNEHWNRKKVIAIILSIVALGLLK